MAPNSQRTQHNHTIDTYREEVDVQAKLKRMRENLSLDFSAKSNLKPKLKAKKKSIVRKLTNILVKHHAPTNAAISKSHKEHIKIATKVIKPRDHQSSFPTASDSNLSTDSYIAQNISTPVIEPIKIKLLKTSRRSSIQDDSGFTDSDCDSFWASEQDDSSGSKASKPKRQRKPVDLNVNWIVQRDAPNRKDIDALCFCNFIKSRDHMVQCSEGRICRRIASNWFHASCVMFSDMSLEQFVMKGKPFICGDCHPRNRGKFETWE